jgi:hypothetical protein
MLNGRGGAHVTFLAFDKANIPQPSSFGLWSTYGAQFWNSLASHLRFLALC